jgi:CspA family cold shock protein
MENKETGKVKWFNPSKGFGFINRLNDETDIFVHYSQIKQKGYKSLNTGDNVSFVVFETKNGLQAKDVAKITTR